MHASNAMNRASDLEYEEYLKEVLERERRIKKETDSLLEHAAKVIIDRVDRAFIFGCHDHDPQFRMRMSVWCKICEPDLMMCTKRAFCGSRGLWPSEKLQESRKVTHLASETL